MPIKTRGTRKHTIGIAVLAIVAVLLIAAFIILQRQKATPPPSPVESKKAAQPAIAKTPKPVMDYNQLDSDPALSGLMQSRKEKYGVEKGIDMVVKSDEAIKVGDRTVSMEEIIDKARIQRGEVVEKDIKGSQATSREPVRDYGIHIVQPGDNIWNIHFQILKDYFDRKQISLSPMADEPKQDGLSSGVGKILKFSENLVQIYNLKERRLATDLNLIHPLSKIVVYNMEEVFALLDQINYEKVNRIQFDGETLWIPAEQ